MIAEAIDDHLDRGGRIGDEDQIELVGIGVEESKCTFSNRIDAVTCQC